MNKALQIVLTDETRAMVESIINQASSDFKNGRIRVSDVINEMILTSRVDVKVLQNKNINLKKSLRLLAARDDLDSEVIEQFLEDLKLRPTKKSKSTHTDKESRNEQS